MKLVKTIYKILRPYLELCIVIPIFFAIGYALDYAVIKTTFFVLNPVPVHDEWNIEYKHKVKTEPVYKEITNTKNGHRYLTPEEKEWVLTQTDKAGFKREDVKCLIEHESSYDEEGKLINAGKVLSVDRGLFALNDYYHSEVSNKCSYDYRCSTFEFIRIAKANKSFNAWTGWVNNCK